MRIRLDDTEQMDDLCAHYLRSGFTVEPMGPAVVDVTRLDAPSTEQERYEVLLHLRVWQVVNPESEAELIR